MFSETMTTDVQEEVETHRAENHPAKDFEIFHALEAHKYEDLSETEIVILERLFQLEDPR
jgi:hypothetical protein